MFNFSDNHKNPLMFLMNMMNTEDAQAGDGAEDKAAEDPLALMKQAFGMQLQMMQMMQTLCMMPLQLLQSFAEALENGAPDPSGSGAETAGSGQGGFKLGSVEIPPRVLAWLMQLDMSPENLGKLQRVLDFLFDAMPQPKAESSEQEDESK